ncbi:hypothetical protein D3C85_1357490 [compost metagenome]
MQQTSTIDYNIRVDVKINWGLHEYIVARLRERLDSHVECPNDTRRLGDPLRFHPEPKASHLPVNDGFAV